jgi:hypothetical protein
MGTDSNHACCTRRYRSTGCCRTCSYKGAIQSPFRHSRVRNRTRASPAQRSSIAVICITWLHIWKTPWVATRRNAWITNWIARLAVRSIWKSLKAFRATLRFIAAHAEISLAVGMNSNSILTSRAAETACSRCETGKSFEGNKLCDLTTSEIVSGIRRPTRFMA